MGSLNVMFDGLGWLYVKEEERHSEIKDRDVFLEAYQRGQKILDQILDLFPNKKIKSTPNFIASNGGHGFYANIGYNPNFDLGIDFYECKNPNPTNLVIIRYSKPITSSTNSITGLDILIFSHLIPFLNGIENRIMNISEEHKKKDGLNKMHELNIQRLNYPTEI